MSVNLSAKQLQSDTIVSDVSEALEQSGLAASSLVLEITETVTMEDTELAVARLEDLKAVGVLLAMHRGDGRVPGRGELVEPLEEPQLVEPRRAGHGRTRRQGGEQRRDEAVDMEQRHDVETSVGRFQLEGLGDVRR